MEMKIATVHPLRDRVLLTPDSGADMIGRIHVPEMAKGKSQTGTVVEVGIDTKELEAGDRVIYRKYAGTNIEDTNWLIVPLDEVLATFIEE